MKHIFSNRFKGMNAVLVVLILTMVNTSLGVEYYLRADTTIKTMPGDMNIPMWGFALDTDANFTTQENQATVPGPVLTVDREDETLNIHLYNNLIDANVPVSIVIPGQIHTTMIPVRHTNGRVRSFTHETLPGQVQTYTWNNVKPGTYVYLSGTHPAVQVQMGLYGGLKKDALTTNLGEAGNYNIFILEDLYQQESSSQGNIAVGGNAWYQNYGAATSFSDSAAKVVVGGNLEWESGSVGNGTGSIFVGGTADVNSVGYGMLKTGGQKEVNFNAANIYLPKVSSFWSTLVANGSANVVGGTITLTGTDPNLNIFDVNGADMSIAGLLDINIPSGSAAIVNINDTSVQMQSYGTTPIDLDPNHVIYNLYEATDVTITLASVTGSILAPLAAIDMDQANIRGTLLGKSLGTSGSPDTGEGRTQLFQGSLPVIDANQSYEGIFYDNDTMLLFSEIDPVLHEAVANDDYGPGKSVTSTMNYKPKYFLINGEPYSPGTPSISVGNENDRILLRFINAGLETHVPVLQGIYGTVIAEDGFPYPYPREQYSIDLPAQKTKDVLIVPTAAGTIPIYDRRLRLTNANISPGGMLVNLDVTEEQVVQPLGSESGPDFDDDGDVDLNDFSEFITHWLHTGACPGDLNGSLSVDFKDYALFSQGFKP